MSDNPYRVMAEELETCTSHILDHEKVEIVKQAVAMLYLIACEAEENSKGEDSE